MLGEKSGKVGHLCDVFHWFHVTMQLFQFAEQDLGKEYTHPQL